MTPRGLPQRREGEVAHKLPCPSHCVYWVALPGALRPCTCGRRPVAPAGIRREEPQGHGAALLAPAAARGVGQAGAEVSGTARISAGCPGRPVSMQRCQVGLQLLVFPWGQASGQEGEMCSMMGVGVCVLQSQVAERGALGRLGPNLKAVPSSANSLQ